MPPSPQSKATQPVQQRIALKLPAIADSFQPAERRARELGRSIADQSFDWADWLPSHPKAVLAIDWTQKLREDYFNKRAETPKSLTTWQGYASILSRLDPYQPLTPDSLRSLVLSYPPDSRVRQRACQVAKMLAAFAQVDFNPRPYRGNYGLAQLEPRYLPSDQEIEKIGDRLCQDSPAWGQVFGLLAAYGLRPHEIHYLKWTNPPRLEVLTGGKSNSSRSVYPYRPEWVDRWGLVGGALPRLSGKNNSAIGNRVTVAFRRWSVGFVPYDLRHAWAVRSLRYRLPVEIAARQMGHSLAVHCRIYHHWIGQDTHAEAWAKSLDNAPKP